MRKGTIRALSALLLCLPALSPATEPAAAIAARLLDRLQAQDYAAAEAMFTAQMAAAVPQDRLKAVWESMPAQLGALRKRGVPQAAAQGGVQSVLIRLNYADAAIDARVAIDADGRVAGLLFQPAPPPAAAPVADDAGFVERDFVVGAGERALPGTLALPKDAGLAAAANVPAVVLVHGSGPNDRDESIGANRPFLDIARGLAAQGIAVLRYGKRTQARPQDFAGKAFDVDDETTDDAAAAVAALAATPGIDGKRIFVLGHSQGGMLAPRIARESGQVAGLILFAAPARPLLTLLPEQNRYLFGLDGQITAEEQAFLDKLDAQIAAIRGDAADASTDTPLGLPAGYWRSTEAVDARADAKASAPPLLLLQGGRDIQVTETDWRLWQDAFGSDPRATLKRYPALNHLGIAGEGPGSLDEYRRPGHVDAQLIADTAAWIRER